MANYLTHTCPVIDTRIPSTLHNMLLVHYRMIVMYSVLPYLDSYINIYIHTSTCSNYILHAIYNVLLTELIQ